MSSFEIAVKFVLKNEGGVSINKSDLGGITNFGISLRFLRGFGLKYDFNKDGVVDEEEIKCLTEDQAKQIYLSEFWNVNNYTLINNQSVANYLFDTAVNVGSLMANKLVQRALKAWNIYSHLNEDGICGPQTIFEINKARDSLLPSLRSERSNYYRRIVEKNPSQEIFLKGWLSRAYSF